MLLLVPMVLQTGASQRVIGFHTVGLYLGRASHSAYRRASLDARAAESPPEDSIRFEPDDHHLVRAWKSEITARVFSHGTGDGKTGAKRKATPPEAGPQEEDAAAGVFHYVLQSSSSSIVGNRTGCRVVAGRRQPRAPFFPIAQRDL